MSNAGTTVSKYSGTECTCRRCPASRRERGLKCFADPTLTGRGTASLGPGEYRHYSAAVAANPGKRVRKVRGGLGTGGPSVFAVVS